MSDTQEGQASPKPFEDNMHDSQACRLRVFDEQYLRWLHQSQAADNPNTVPFEDWKAEVLTAMAATNIHTIILSDDGSKTEFNRDQQLA